LLTFDGEQLCLPVRAERDHNAVSAQVLDVLADLMRLRLVSSSLKTFATVHLVLNSVGVRIEKVDSQWATASAVVQRMLLSLQEVAMAHGSGSNLFTDLAVDGTSTWWLRDFLIVIMSFIDGAGKPCVRTVGVVEMFQGKTAQEQIKAIFVRVFERIRVIQKCLKGVFTEKGQPDRIRSFLSIVHLQSMTLDNEMRCLFERVLCLRSQMISSFRLRVVLAIVEFVSAMFALSLFWSFSFQLGFPSHTANRSLTFPLRFWISWSAGRMPQ
jgi:hypothetical protein